MINIISGKIQIGVLYFVYGAQTVNYNGTSYATGQYFRGISGVNVFTYSGSGTQLVYEALEIRGSAIEYAVDATDRPVFFDTTKLSGFAIEYMQGANDITVNDVTVLNGFAIELLDYPFYSFAIIEIRL